MLAKELRFIERFKAQAAKAAQVQSRVKKLEKIDKVEPPKRRKKLEFEFPPCARSGEDVVKIERLGKRYGEKVIYDGLVLARILYERPNFLVLDEPTNHLDMATKDMIVRSLRDYEGTMLFVSHDRQFLAQLSTRVLELGPGGPTPYGGGYVEYVARSG